MKTHCVSGKDATLQAVATLQEQIEDWLDEYYEHVVPKMAQKYIQKHMSECIKSPFGRFYLLYKIHKGRRTEDGPPDQSVQT